MDNLQTTLDVIGLIPVIGNVADGVNAAIHLARGNLKEAALSGLAMIPGYGQAATVVKGARKVAKIAKNVKKGHKVVKHSRKAAKLWRTAIDAAETYDTAKKAIGSAQKVDKFDQMVKNSSGQK